VSGEALPPVRPWRLALGWLLAAGTAAAARTWLGNWAAPATATALLVLPLVRGGGLQARLRPEPRRALLGALEGLAAAALLIPLFLLGLWLLRLVTPAAPADLWGTLAAAAPGQLLLVALPEEFFFRGWLQREFDRLRPGRVRFLGAPCSWALPAAATLFALTHALVEMRPAAALVFFPALAFGWLFARRGSIAGAAALHAACNLSLLFLPALAWMPGR
jgi:membrane protease YdiL (CAAX protease family)